MSLAQHALQAAQEGWEPHAVRMVLSNAYAAWADQAELELIATTQSEGMMKPGSRGLNPRMICKRIIREKDKDGSAQYASSLPQSIGSGAVSRR